ncbi:hypothetical protein JHK82_017247 [Glycine max]|uniref:Protein kinase domain-containing protein n=2 Tax=Glycine subgen. Soja TaxID=1462606 RepID=K7KZ08_SOYBN|nr:hypothetical protein JHK86_017299 [Glycine max]KAG5141552.1 hypothetical protein JHK82_017247 [Glycine max]RZC00842.1 Receptor-like protein kinase [Glycine soja]
MTSRNLSSSKLRGEINMSFSHLTELVFLDLSHNELEGPLLEFLVELPKLKILNVTGNRLLGPIPKALKEKADWQLRWRCYPSLQPITWNDETSCLHVSQGYKEFRSEAQLLVIVHHRNLVSLIGYCGEGESKALIYEYMANGNLHQHLSVEPKLRLIIAVDAAQDLKPSNILLDQSMHAKIADFGLYRAFGSHIDSHISTLTAGPLGYVDPDDIYSFGIILFELITGQHAISRTPEKNIHILEWVIPIVERGDIHNIVDPKLKEAFNVNSAWKALKRPDISQILPELKECLSS